MSAPLTGLLCPVPTPFTAAGPADPDRLAAQIRIYADLGVDGILVFGTSGEGPLLDDAEEAELLAAAREAVPAGRPLMVQVGRESARAAAAAAARAVAGGADALLCLPPRYYTVGEAGLGAYFRAVAARAEGRPVLAYHIPQITGVALPAGPLARWAGEGTIAGVKDSAGDLVLQARLRQTEGPGFAIFNGRAAVTAAALRGGADGAILAVADVAPEAAVRLLAGWRAGDGEAMESAQALLAPLADTVGPRWGVPGIKAALDARGWPGGGDPRPPLLPLGPEARREVTDALRAAGIAVA